MPDYFYQITDLNNNVKGEIRDKALTDLETAANAGKFIQISGNQTLAAVAESVFVATYGTTTASQVQAAIDAGKLVMAMKPGGESIALLCGIASTVYSFSYSAPNATVNTGYPWFSMWTLNRSTNSWNTVHTTQVAKRENSDLTGTPTAPTAAAGTNTTQIATTAFVQTAINNADDAEILTYGDASVTYANVATKVSAGKVLFAHYSDSSDNVTLPYVCTTTSGSHIFTNMVGNTRWTIYLSNADVWSVASAALAPLASPAFTGNPTAPTQAAGNNSTRIATTAFVNTAITNANSIFIIGGTYQSGTGITNIDKTYAQIQRAISNGKTPIIIADDGHGNTYFYYPYHDNSGQCKFYTTTGNTAEITSGGTINNDVSNYAKWATVASVNTTTSTYVTKDYTAGNASKYEVRYAKFLEDNSTNSSAVPDAANKIIWFYE